MDLISNVGLLNLDPVEAFAVDRVQGSNEGGDIGLEIAAEFAVLGGLLDLDRGELVVLGASEDSEEAGDVRVEVVARASKCRGRRRGRGTTTGTLAPIFSAASAQYVQELEAQSAADVRAARSAVRAAAFPQAQSGCGCARGSQSDARRDLSQNVNGARQFVSIGTP